MRVGIFISKYHLPTTGGGYTFQESIVQALKNFRTEHELIIFYHGNEFEDDHSSVKFVSLQSEQISFIRRAIQKLIKFVVHRGQKRKMDMSILNLAARKYKIELMWYITPVFENVDIPFIYTVWDLQHRLQPFFPEVSVSGWLWSERENHYASCLPRATYVITGTEEGKREIMQFYNIDPDRIRVLPLPTPTFSLNTRKAKAQLTIVNEISRPFLFYPAQFWPHKNHIALLLALKILHDEYGLEFNLVLTGADKGNLEHVKTISAELGLADKVYYIGFVSFDDMIYLYNNAFALVFPSFFGPDNLPPLEAMSFGCPVIAANQPGVCEQLGGAAILIDPSEEHEIARAIRKLYSNKKYRKNLIERGYKRAKSWTANDYVNEMNNIINEFQPYRRCWSDSAPYIHK